MFFSPFQEHINLLHAILLSKRVMFPMLLPVFLLPTSFGFVILYVQNSTSGDADHLIKISEVKNAFKLENR